MAFDWRTLITVSSSADGWSNVNASGSPNTNIVRDVVVLPYYEHKSIVIWMQESPGFVTGTAPTATVTPSFRLMAAVIDQTRTIEDVLADDRRIFLAEATSTNTGTPTIARIFAPLTAAKLFDNSADTAGFVVSFDWGTEDSSGTLLSAHHQLVFCKVTGTTLSRVQMYEDSAVTTASRLPSIVFEAGPGRAAWFKTKTGGTLHTSHVVSATSLSSSLTVNTGVDLPVGVVSLDGFVGWQGTTNGFITHASDMTDAYVLPYTLLSTATGVTFGTSTKIVRGVNANVKILPGQRIESFGPDNFLAFAVIESFSGGPPPGGPSIYDENFTYDNPYSYDPTAISGSPPPPTTATSAYDTAIPYDSSALYNTAGGDVTGTTQVLDQYPQIFNISLTGGAFSVASETSKGQLYRRDAVAGEEVILGTGVPAAASYQATGIGGHVAAVNSALDAISPIDTSRFYGQEIVFDPINAPARMLYPSTVAPFTGKYATNQTQVDVGIAIVGSGAFFAFVNGSAVGTPLDRPLRVSYFENQFAPTATLAFSGDDGNNGNNGGGDVVGTVTDPDELTIEQRFGHTTPGHMLCLNADIDLNGLLLNRLDLNGVLWVCTGIDGWWAPPEPTIPTVSRGYVDGEYASEGRYGPRTITINGIFIPKDRSGVADARDRLIRAINLAHGQGYLRTIDDTYQRQSTVILSGAPQIETINQHGRTEFTIGLKCPDPVKYEVVTLDPATNFRTAQAILGGGSVQSSGRTYSRSYPWTYHYDITNPTGTFTISNFGNYSIQPTFVLLGPVEAGAKIVNQTTNQTITMPLALSSAETMTIDTMVREVSINGTPNFRSRLSVDSEWIYLQPGENTLALIAATTGAPRLTVQWRSGWIG